MKTVTVYYSNVALASIDINSSISVITVADSIKHYLDQNMDLQTYILEFKFHEVQQLILDLRFRGSPFYQPIKVNIPGDLYIPELRNISLNDAAFKASEAYKNDPLYDSSIYRLTLLTNIRVDIESQTCSLGQFFLRTATDINLSPDNSQGGIQPVY